jgi:hypothetical protein
MIIFRLNLPPRQPQSGKSRVPSSQFKQPCRMLRQKFYPKQSESVVANSALAIAIKRVLRAIASTATSHNYPRISTAA